MGGGASKQKNKQPIIDQETIDKDNKEEEYSISEEFNVFGSDSDIPDSEDIERILRNHRDPDQALTKHISNISTIKGSGSPKAKFQLDRLSDFSLNDFAKEMYQKRPRVFKKEQAYLLKGQYSGQLYKELPMGRGVFYWNDGYVYDGEWQDGMLHGRGKYGWRNNHFPSVFEKGDYDKIIKSYKGRFSENRLHGPGKIT